MAQKDGRGVVLPAPIKFENPATVAGSRYDDEHRGPAVADAYELSRCRVDLAERSDIWAALENFPARMMELAQAIPEDQRTDWLRRQANLDEVDRLISCAMRSGELPIWVAPIGEPERLVASSTMLEVDRATIVSGCYRPPNDRGWLYGRPLFVKRDDWVSFVASVDAERAKPRACELPTIPDADTPALPPIAPFVSLSEAVSWIAFGVSMGSDDLHAVLAENDYGGHDPQESIRDAVAGLTGLGSGWKIAMRGKYREGHHANEKTLLTAYIEPIRLEDYRQFSYLSDELRHGEGLLFWRNPDGTILDFIIGEGRKDSFLQVTVNRAELLREFPPQEPARLGQSYLRSDQSFNRDDPATIAPWWSVNQTLAWIATRIPSYVEHIGNAETSDSSAYRPYFTQAICESQVAESDEGKVFMADRRANWPTGSFLAHAGRALLENILIGLVRPMARESGKGRRMQPEEFVGIGAKETGGDWLDLKPQPLFSSAEVMRIFPVEALLPMLAATCVTSMAGAENECREWLVEGFLADCEKRQSKKDFRDAALAAFPGRLTVRGFDLRVYARRHDRIRRSGRGQALRRRRLQPQNRDRGARTISRENLHGADQPARKDFGILRDAAARGAGPRPDQPD